MKKPTEDSLWAKGDWDKDALQSSYQRGFHGGPIERTEPFYPVDNTHVENTKFAGNASSREDFPDYFAQGFRPDTEARKAASTKNQSSGLSGDNQFHGATTSRSDYPDYGAHKPPAAFRPKESTTLGNMPLNASSANKSDYPNYWESGRPEITQAIRKDSQSSQLAAGGKFEGASSSQEAFAAAANSARDPSKPIRHADNLGLEPGRKFYGDTTSRGDYKGKQVCPAEPLLAMGRAATPSGHVHFHRHGGRWA